MPNTSKPKKTPQILTNHSYPHSFASPLRRSQRTVHFATKVTPHFDETIRRLAYQKNCLITEMLDQFMEAYLEKEIQELSNEELEKKKIKKDKVKTKIRK